jgi:hypothetical protein
MTAKQDLFDTIKDAFISSNRATWIDTEQEELLERDSMVRKAARAGMKTAILEISGLPTTKKLAVASAKSTIGAYLRAMANKDSSNSDSPSTVAKSNGSQRKGANSPSTVA